MLQGRWDKRRVEAAGVLLCAMAACGYAEPLPAQNDVPEKTVRVVRASEPPVIDGKVDDAVWATAELIDDFRQIRPTNGGAPSERSEIRILYDDDYLYIGARMFDSEPDKITRNVMRHGNALGQDDRLAVIIDPFNTGRNGYRFETNANGVRHDMLYKNINELNRDWTVIWETQSFVDETGWSFEMAIPFKTLPFNPNIDTWGINFARGIRRKGEEVVWVSRNRTYNPNIVGRAVGFSGMDQGVGLDVVPSMSSSRRRTFGVNATSNTEYDPSLDVFYRVTPSLNASLTINTDFSATEIDDRQVNLSRFSLFFPEKRDFFLNDSDLFEFGRIGRTSNQAASAASVQSGRPFFSRRVGLSTTGLPVDLEYGGKLSGRAGRYSIGTMAVRQDEFAGVDASTLSIARVAADVLGESTLGMIFTDGDPRSSSDNTLTGVDFQYLNTRLPGGRTLEAGAWFQETDTPGLDGDDSAFGLGIDVPNAAGWRGGFAVKELGESYNPALGFVSRTGVRDYTAQVGFKRFLGGSGYLNSWFTGLDAQRVNFLDDGGLETEVLYARLLELESRQQDVFRTVYRANREVVRQAFTIYSDQTRTVEIPAGRYEFDETGFELVSAPQRSFAASINYRQGDFYNGERTAAAGEILWKPDPRFNMRFRYDWNDIDLPQGDFTARLFQIATEVAITLNLTWVNLLQYDNASEVLGVNSRLQWIPKAGQKAFIVLNHNLQDFDKDNSFQSEVSDLSVKFAYTFRF